MNINDIVAVVAVRTPMGKFGGILRGMESYDIGAVAIREAVKRSGELGNKIDEVILGSCRQAGNGPNPARTASVRGGIDITVPVYTINMACPSGMKAIHLASQAIRLGEAQTVLAGGFESMSNIPYLLKNARWEGFKMGNKTLEDGWSDSIDPLISMGMGETAENLFDKYNISRFEQDEFACSSHNKAALAQSNGYFNEEITPITISGNAKKPDIIFEKDETIRYDADIEKMSKLQPSFRKNGTVTAGNACGLSDGAVAIVLTSRQNAINFGLKPLFSIISYSETAVDPSTMGEGPALSIPLALKKVNMNLDDIDLIEVNEAFAIQVLANERELKWDRSKLNVNGGAIALGHPTGISGARIVTTLYYALKRIDANIGIASICGGGGVTSAIIIKRES
ncbi:MAG: thiolase family protein [Candidatus Kapabacteria bacterium]|nr:thiolase family protein [Candidatus Kapabacteria bacterium]